jgi:2-polyprenyl-6-methoxyphenol hydroxylase-like FAD-dependent oxidoreductase
VRINLQPNAVRELDDLGIDAAQLDTIAIQAREWALVGRNGNDVYAGPRGLLAGYRWPLYAVHCGQLQMLLLAEVQRRLGPQAVHTGCRVTGYRNDSRGVTAFIKTRDGQRREVAGLLLMAVDGLHSPIRAQTHPKQPPIQWGGAIMQRRAKELFEYPMFDHHAVPTWLDGQVALQACEAKLCKGVSALVLRNRSSGPFAILGHADEHCSGVLDNIDDVIPKAERDEFTARIKQAAGFAIDALNAASPTTAPGARVPQEQV